MSFRPASELAADERVARGMAAQLRRRDRELADGAEALGWKVGFGTPAFLSKLEIAGPLVGYLTDRSPIATGERPSVTGWSNPMIEPEIAVTLQSDLPGGGAPADWRDAIGTLGPAFELAELDPPPEEVERILAGNIYHRRVLLGDSAAAEPDRLGARVVTADGAQAVEDPQELTGEVVAIVGHVADLLAEFDLLLTAGEVVICGSIVPPISVAPGDRVGYELEPLGRIDIELT